MSDIKIKVGDWFTTALGMRIYIVEIKGGNSVVFTVLRPDGSGAYQNRTSLFDVEQAVEQGDWIPDEPPSFRVENAEEGRVWADVYARILSATYPHQAKRVEAQEEAQIAVEKYRELRKK